MGRVQEGGGGCDGVREEGGRRIVWEEAYLSSTPCA